MIGIFDVINIAGVIGEMIALSFAAYWAIRVWKALAIRVYRKAAFGVALIATLLALTEVVNTVSAYLVYGSPFEAIGQGGYGIFFLLLAALFYYVDASVLASRRSDPRVRNTLHWSKLRILLWIGTLPAAVLVVVANVIMLVTTGPNISGPPPASLAIILFSGLFIPPISGAIVLPIASRRTADQSLRKQLKWFALFAASIFVFNLFLTNSVPSQPLALLLNYLGSALGAYCLYRSVSALAPIRPKLEKTGFQS